MVQVITARKNYWKHLKTLEYRKGECSIKSFKPTINSVTKRVPVYEQDYDLAKQSVTEVTTTKTKNKQGK